MLLFYVCVFLYIFIKLATKVFGMLKMYKGFIFYDTYDIMTLVITFDPVLNINAVTKSTKGPEL